jgi:hypothetical protein
MSRRRLSASDLRSSALGPRGFRSHGAGRLRDFEVRCHAPQDEHQYVPVGFFLWAGAVRRIERSTDSARP